ncbi:TatD family hydrolase [Candidatus Kaiserbacteria bacterium]|nr:TatD family hydrolase [Candidatus Kaiserbacteria bacterium]
MRYFDAHTHTNFVAYNEDRDAVIARAKEAGVAMNVVGTQKDTSAAAVELAQKYDNVFATIGLHPVHTSKSYHDVKELGEGGKEFTSRGEMFDSQTYETLGKNPRVIAIGECGLDYYRAEEKTKEVQKEAFIGQIELANRLGKPLMLHIRPAPHSLGDGGNAYDDALEIIQAHAKVCGDVHFFAGDWGIAKRFLDLGFTLSFTGVVTFTHDYDEVVKNTPLDMLLSETDAPYVTPEPFRGKRNEPAYIPEIVRAITRIRGADEEVVAKALFANACRVFGLDGNSCGV